MCCALLWLVCFLSLNDDVVLPFFSLDSKGRHVEGVVWIRPCKARREKEALPRKRGAQLGCSWFESCLLVVIGVKLRLRIQRAPWIHVSGLTYIVLYNKCGNQ